MSKFSKITLLVVLALCCVGASALFGQQTTSSSIRGAVTATEDQSALPGVTVTAVHEPTGTRYTSISQQDGSFAMLNVRVGGPYSVTATLEGFVAQSLSERVVALGETMQLQFSLRLEAVAETINVVSSNALINPSRTGSTSNVPVESIEMLPTISRGLEDFARTNPFFTIGQINEDPVSISVVGRNSRYNNILIDGAVNNDLFGLAAQGTPGGQANTSPISLDAVQELQLLVTPYDVRQGGFSGGGINAITRSGTNRIQASAFYFTRDDGLVGDGPDILGDVGTFEEDQYGFRIGGPISRDKIFFFVNGEVTDATRPSGISIDGSGGEAFQGGTLVEEANLFRQTLIDRYGFDPGGLGQNSIETPSDKLFARFDFNIGESHNLTLRHNFVDAENDINRPSNFAYEWPSETYFFQNETNSTVAQLNSVLGPNTFNEARLVVQKIKDRRSPRGGLAFPWIEIENVIPGSGVEFEAGSEPFSTHNELDQDIFEITNDFTWIRGNHTFVFGTHNELFSFRNLFIQNGFGSYQFATLDDFVQGRNARQYDFTFVQPGRNPAQEFDVNQLGFYAGDQWRVGTNFSLQYGLRVDIPLFPDDPSRNPFTETAYGFRTDDLPSGNEIWSPRIGFNWDITGEGKQQLRGGVGIFSGRTPYVWISNNYGRTGIEQAFVQARNVPFNPDPFNQPSDIGGASFGEFNFIDPDFEFPQQTRYSLGYDRELPWLDLVGSIEAVYSDSIEEIDYADVNMDRTGTQFDGRPIYTRRPGVTGAYLIRNTGEGEATNVAVKLERPLRNNLSWFVSYAYGDSKTVNDGTSSRAVSNYQFNESVDPNNAEVGTSDFEVSDRFNASATYYADWGGSKWGTTFSAFYNHQAGRPFSYIFTNQLFPSINGDAYFSNDLVYVPSGPDDVVIQNGTWDQLDAFISGEPCLDSNRGRIAPRNCGLAPWSHSLDLRVAQDIPISGRHKLQLTADIENVLNMIDEDSGVVRYVNFSTLAPFGWRGNTADGRPMYTLSSFVANPSLSKFTTHSTASRWRAKLGLRWSF
ncbi:MAG TPA: carboxypeptidase regulatory-like domain-containing protein [Thermoanaerobaculia bacterium]|nr:carboxypeptidase regulatory-like domain-containing protein [Thermoanaerobaculia bacterium]